MESVVWNESFSVGDPLVDTHHQVFFQMLAEARAAAGQEAPGAVAQRVAFLVEYTRMHFDEEERLMAAWGFPGLEDHRRVHEQFAAQVGGMADALALTPDRVSMDSVLAMMEAWLTDHILGTDQQFAPWVDRHKPA